MIAEAALRTLLNHARDKVLVLDGSGTVTYANAAVERVLGYDREEFVGTGAFEYVHPDDREYLAGLFGDVLSGDSAEGTTDAYRYQASDGSWVWMESSVVDLSDTPVEGFAVCSREVTDRVEAVEAREQTLRDLEVIAAKSNDVLWMFDADWSELHFLNEAAEPLYGIQISEVQADPQRFLDAVHPDDVDTVRAAMEQLSAGEPIDIEYRVNAERDYRRWVWAQGQPVKADGDVVRVVGFSRDITERRRRERQLEVMDTLLRHNLRNDMNVILGHAELAMGTGNPAVQEHGEMILDVGQSLLATAEKQRDVIELLTTPGQVHRLDLGETIAHAVEDVKRQAPAASVEVDIPERIEALCVDQFTLAVHELLENAVKHARDVPHLAISGVVHDAEVELVFRDNGPVIPDMEYRVLSGERELSELYHGGGLGMWLVYWAVDLSNGSVEFTERPEGGNEVTVRLPRPSEM